MSTDYVIMIPTLARGPQLQKTWDNLSPRLRRSTRLVVARSELRDFQAAKLPAEVCPAQGRDGLGAVRQWCLAWAQRNAIKKLVLLDDDLNTWSLRGADGQRVTYLKTNPATVELVFSDMLRLLNKYAHGAIGHRLFANNRELVEYNGRALRALFYRADVLEKARARFDVRTMSDFDMTLKLLRAGFANVITNTVVQDHNGSNTAGGCSTYRDQDEMMRAATTIVERYAPFAQLVTKTTGGWHGEGAERADVRVQWKKMATYYRAGAL
jgi:hypothetical protein